MKTLFCALSLGLSTLISLPHANAGEKPAPPKTGAKVAKKPAPINLKLCPISGESVANTGRGGQIVGGYRVQFCCPDCPKTFAKMPTAEKVGRVKELAARQAKTKRV